MVVASVLGLGAFTLSGSAAATYTAPIYPINGCRGLQYADEQNMYRDVAGGSITALNDFEMVCPIVKYTSGPSVSSGDAISSVSVLAGVGLMTCTVGVYEVYPGTSGSTNVVQTASNSNYGYYFTVNVSTTATNYWQSSTRWRYAQLYCAVGVGTHVYNYTVTENGSSQTGARITSAANCTPPAVNAYGFNAATSSWAGFVQARATETQFAMSCPALSGGGNYLQVGLGPNITPGTTNYMGCRDVNVANSFLSVSGSEFPPKIVTFSSTATPRSLVCEMLNHPSVGDGKVYSYRTSPSAF